MMVQTEKGLAVFKNFNGDTYTEYFKNSLLKNEELKKIFTEIESIIMDHGADIKDLGKIVHCYFLVGSAKNIIINDITGDLSKTVKTYTYASEIL